MKRSLKRVNGEQFSSSLVSGGPVSIILMSRSDATQEGLWETGAYKVGTGRTRDGGDQRDAL